MRRVWGQARRARMHRGAWPRTSTTDFGTGVRQPPVHTRGSLGCGALHRGSGARLVSSRHVRRRSARWRSSALGSVPPARIGVRDRPRTRTATHHDAHHDHRRPTADDGADRPPTVAPHHDRCSGRATGTTGDRRTSAQRPAVGSAARPVGARRGRSSPYQGFGAWLDTYDWSVEFARSADVVGPEADRPHGGRGRPDPLHPGQPVEQPDRRPRAGAAAGPHRPGPPARHVRRRPGTSRRSRTRPPTCAASWPSPAFDVDGIGIDIEARNVRDVGERNRRLVELSRAAARQPPGQGHRRHRARAGADRGRQPQLLAGVPVGRDGAVLRRVDADELLDQPQGAVAGGPRLHRRRTSPGCASASASPRPWSTPSVASATRRRSRTSSRWSRPRSSSGPSAGASTTTARASPSSGRRCGRSARDLTAVRLSDSGNMARVDRGDEVPRVRGSP